MPNQKRKVPDRNTIVFGPFATNVDNLERELDTLREETRGGDGTQQNITNIENIVRIEGTYYEVEGLPPGVPAVYIPANLVGQFPITTSNVEDLRLDTYVTDAYPVSGAGVGRAMIGPRLDFSNVLNRGGGAVFGDNMDTGFNLRWYAPPTTGTVSDPSPVPGNNYDIWASAAGYIFIFDKYQYTFSGTPWWRLSSDGTWTYDSDSPFGNASRPVAMGPSYDTSKLAVLTGSTPGSPGATCSVRFVDPSTMEFTGTQVNFTGTGAQSCGGRVQQRHVIMFQNVNDVGTRIFICRAEPGTSTIRSFDFLPSQIDGDPLSATSPCSGDNLVSIGYNGTAFAVESLWDNTTEIIEDRWLYRPYSVHRMSLSTGISDTAVGVLAILDEDGIPTDYVLRTVYSTEAIDDDTVAVAGNYFDADSGMFYPRLVYVHFGEVVTLSIVNMTEVMNDDPLTGIWNMQYINGEITYVVMSFGSNGYKQYLYRVTADLE